MSAIKKQPQQPMYLDGEGKQPRFQSNSIIRWIWESGRINLRDISLLPFPVADLIQLHQLLGCSVDFIGERYAEHSPEIVAELDRGAEALLQQQTAPVESRAPKNWGGEALCGTWRVVTQAAHNIGPAGFDTKVKLNCGHEALFKHCTSPGIVGVISCSDKLKCHRPGCCSSCCPSITGV